MTEMFGEAWSPMSVPDLAPDDDDDDSLTLFSETLTYIETLRDYCCFLFRTNLKLIPLSCCALGSSVYLL